MCFLAKSHLRYFDKSNLDQDGVDNPIKMIKKFYKWDSRHASSHDYMRFSNEFLDDDVMTHPRRRNRLGKKDYVLLSWVVCDGSGTKTFSGQDALILIYRNPL
ncbi:hypothetical protein CEXT_579521 [Caerostris extrusa]|uniref:Uncharacterized protein n=1 Tax=Caerostris extrusa TaxID=172846 RepID=A0AAV4V120_CAEEX|nr:hypothetical protein CEXT_579521 [Caerostris extrusa]